MTEAESFPGPSVVIAYTPCIAHGIKAGMANIQDEAKRAVESGYWPLYRYDPRKEIPFQLDSKPPTLSYQDFIKGETRYASLEISFPKNAKTLFAKAEEDAKKRYAELEKLARP
jgi:pyruvate-ferredoxin/flavodoxin oxidoreductase